MNCLQKGTKTACTGDCAWCDGSGMSENAAISAAFSGAKWCTVSGSSCTCKVPEASATTTPTPSPTATPEAGFCAPAADKLSAACEWKAITVADGKNVTCGSIDWGKGGCPTSSSASYIAPSVFAAAVLAVAAMF